MPRSPEPDLTAVAAAMHAWQAAHPEATLEEIEQAVDAQLSAYRAALISQVAQAGEGDERPDCPGCGRAMHRSQVRSVTKQTAHRGAVELQGQSWVCPACGAGLFPPG